MALFEIPFQDYRTFFLILARISVLLFFFPFFNARVIPVLGKAGLALIISLMLLPVVELPSDRFPETWAGTVQLVIGELLLGLVLGLMLQIFFEGVRVMGQLVGFQAGFAVASILDPQSGTQASIMANMAYFVAVLLF